MKRTITQSNNKKKKKKKKQKKKKKKKKKKKNRENCYVPLHFLFDSSNQLIQEKIKAYGPGPKTVD